MLKLALLDYPAFEIDTRELTRTTPSFMIDTLDSFRDEFGYTMSITLCLGMDAFMLLPQWHAWQKILKRCHLLIIERAKMSEESLPEVLKSIVLAHEIFDKNTLMAHTHGKIYRFDAGYYPISSSWLRSQLLAGYSIERYVPAPVYQYIKDQALYTPEK